VLYIDGLTGGKNPELREEMVGEGLKKNLVLNLRENLIS
jgi:hypothetical protein